MCIVLVMKSGENINICLTVDPELPVVGEGKDGVALADELAIL